MTMIKCLKALPTAMAAEHGYNDDLFLTAPGELLSIPVHACREQNNPHCQCRRVFVGLSTGQPTTLARVAVCTETEAETACDTSDDIIRLHDEEDAPEDGILLHAPNGIAYAIRNFEVGSIVRIDRTDEAIVLLDSCQLAVRH